MRSIRRTVEFMVEFVAIILIGLTDGVSDDSDRHERAITSIKMVLRGDLLTTAARVTRRREAFPDFRAHAPTLYGATPSDRAT